MLPSDTVFPVLCHCGEGYTKRIPGPPAQPGSEFAKKIQKNEEQAHRDGKLEGKLETAKAMLRDGLPLATVIRCTGLTEDQITREMKKDSGV
jgi:hypothetical protein